MLCMYCACHGVASVNCCIVFTCLKRVGLLAPACDVYLVFVTLHLVSWVRSGVVLDCNYS